MNTTMPAYELAEMSQILKMIADPARIGILHILVDGEHNVTSIHTQAGLPQPTVSRHLAQMRLLRLVNSRRVGKQVMYSLGSQFRRATDGGLSLELANASVSLFSHGMSPTVAAA